MVISASGIIDGGRRLSASRARAGRRGGRALRAAQLPAERLVWSAFDRTDDRPRGDFRREMKAIGGSPETRLGHGGPSWQRSESRRSGRRSLPSPPAGVVAGAATPAAILEAAMSRRS